MISKDDEDPAVHGASFQTPVCDGQIETKTSVQLLLCGIYGTVGDVEDSGLV